MRLFLFFFFVIGTVFSQDFAKKAIPFNTPEDLESLITNASDKRLVLLGEATHGTHEFYKWRDIISRELITKHGFNFIVVEGDFARLYELNRYVKSEEGAASSAREILFQLERWPTWMWGNEETVTLVEWLRVYNKSLPIEKKVGFYGMDVYDEWTSMKEIIELLKKVDPVILHYVQNQYDCFKDYENDSWGYAWDVYDDRPDCAKNTRNVVDFIQNQQEKLKKQLSDDAYFYLLQNALVIHNAEEFYRTSVTHKDVVSWNARVYHMDIVIQNLLTHYGEGSKGVVWAHNSHVGDNRFTAVGRDTGAKSIGQLSRERLGVNNVFLVGLTAYEGKTLAAKRWNATMETMNLKRAKRSSVEHKMKKIKIPSYYVIFDADGRKDMKKKLIPNRGVGVVYRPDRDYEFYMPSIVPMKYDALLFFDKTSALKVFN